MALLTPSSITKETVHKVACTVCCIREAHVFNSTSAEALREFRAEGWRTEEDHILCPACAISAYGEEPTK